MLHSEDGLNKIVMANMRRIRIEKGLAQKQMAVQIGITPQQYQKYESGKDRISSGRLIMIASVLDVPVTEMYRGANEVITRDADVCLANRQAKARDTYP